MLRTGVRPATRNLKHPSFVAGPAGDLIDYFKRPLSLAFGLVTPTPALHLRFLLPQSIIYLYTKPLLLCWTCLLDTRCYQTATC